MPERKKCESKYSYEPVIFCLGAVTFFRVSKLTHRRPERQCNPARYPKPRKKANRSCGRGHGWQPFTGGDISLNSLTEAPVVFSAFAVGKTASPERSVRRMQRGQDIPHVKGLKKTRG
ncbi:MAG: hypothetical protein C4B57_07580 [Deltaproteobacteria bacterium]|nr:MAG: hypothetical protein C4B57_07580 [Deltaproteobacteria bacterium]